MEQKYLKTFSRYLKMSKKEKKKIILNLKEEINYRKQNGESPEKIFSDLGPANQLAQEFNLNFDIDESKLKLKEKINIIILSVVGSICIILAIYNSITLFIPKLSIQYIFSGVNLEGNIGVFAAFHLGIKEILAKIIIELLIGLILFIIIFIKKKKM